MSFAEWPELATVSKEQRFELVVKDAKGRNPSLSDDELQKSVFSKNPQLNFVSISGCGLSHLSPSITSCSQLTKLVIIRNELVSVPDEIGRGMNRYNRKGFQLTNAGLFDFSALQALLVLDISHNELTSVPATLTGGQLVRLHTLNLAHNKITEVTPKLNVIEHMKTLNLSENEITSLPWAIGQMEKIRILDLSQNPFKDGRFRKLANDKRAKVSAVVAYIAKHAPRVTE
ncbi:leucine Rich repeat-containing domain protein, partial [Ancylostoma caninum]